MDWVGLSCDFCKSNFGWDCRSHRPPPRTCESGKHNLGLEKLGIGKQTSYIGSPHYMTSEGARIGMVQTDRQNRESERLDWVSGDLDMYRAFGR